MLPFISHVLFLKFLFVYVSFVYASYSFHREELYPKPLTYRIGREQRELIQCPVEDCDGTGHISGNFATHRRQANPRARQAASLL